ncbi:MAG: hypothetical protein ACJASV_002373 [Pseudorhodobacter sp.]|jgi:hypothetical protein
MQVFRQIDPEAAALVGWGVRVMLLTPDRIDAKSKTAVRLAGLGGIVEAEHDVFAAIETMINNATGFGLFVVECDAFGGLEAGHQIISMMHKGGVILPSILVSQDCNEQLFPDEPHEPIVLRAPLSAVGLRVGFEHALRDRLIYAAA